MKNRKSNGQSLIEYVALTALVAIVSIGTVKVFGNKVRTRLNQITTTFDRNIQQGLKAKRGIEDESEDNSHLPNIGLPRLPFPGMSR
jgi:Flp pilus assembly pilin Flp